MNSKDVISDLEKLSNPKKIPVFQNFFKTGKGQYGEGDIFLGITVPTQRKIAKQYIHLPLEEVEKVLHSKIHEHRLTALIIWTYQYEKADEATKKKIYKLYLKNTDWINNWDLVDVTAPRIVGEYIYHNLDSESKTLFQLAYSENLWKKRIAIISTLYFIKKNNFDATLNISDVLVNDEHDLIHKAVGWMLREVGKKNQNIEEKFLRKHYKTMPRTMLRYAIEKFDKKKKAFYMKK